jgi:hypothetical protein
MELHSLEVFPLRKVKKETQNDGLKRGLVRPLLVSSSLSIDEVIEF